MNTILTDSLAREHAADIEAAARRSRRRREARSARRARGTRHGNAAPDEHGSTHHRAASVSHAAGRPFVVFRHWLVAGQL